MHQSLGELGQKGKLGVGIALRELNSPVAQRHISLKTSSPPFAKLLGSFTSWSISTILPLYSVNAFHSVCALTVKARAGSHFIWLSSSSSCPRNSDRTGAARSGSLVSFFESPSCAFCMSDVLLRGQVTDGDSDRLCIAWTPINTAILFI
jgi:hypothetical protein